MLLSMLVSRERNNNFESNPKVKIKCLDAYEAERDKFDFFFVDT